MLLFKSVRARLSKGIISYGYNFLGQAYFGYRFVKLESGFAYLLYGQTLVFGGDIKFGIRALAHARYDIIGFIIAQSIRKPFAHLRRGAYLTGVV